ncbi:MAG: hypothetical protein ACI8ZM_000820 [Crocinitomix sp.]|jgi:hypothetical protein
MSRVTILLIVSILISCSGSRELEGTWISVSNKSTRQPSMIFALNKRVTTFNNGTCETFSSGSYPKVSKRTYVLYSDKITYNEDPDNVEIIKNLTKDTIQVIGDENEKNSVGAFAAWDTKFIATYYKLPTALKNKGDNIDVSGKRYELKYVLSREVIGTFDFITDSTLLSNALDPRKTMNLRYDLIKQNGFTIIFIDFLPQMVIKKVGERNIIAVKYGKVPQEVEFIEIE